MPRGKLNLRLMLAVEEDEIVVRRGSYREHVILKKRVTLSDSGPDGGTIYGVAPGISWNPGKDLEGNPRISGMCPDMGAYESPREAPNYLLERSENLVNWTEGYYGPGTSWIDPCADSIRTKFYRVRIGKE